MIDGTDEAPARVAVAGDRAAREAHATLVDRHYNRTCRVGARMSGEGDEASDLAQEVCIDLPATLTTHYRGRFTARLYRVVVDAVYGVLHCKAARERGAAD